MLQVHSLTYMWLIHNQAMSPSANSSPKRTAIGTSTNNFSWTVWYFGCDGVKHSLLGAKIQVFCLWRIRWHLPCHTYLHHLCLYSFTTKDPAVAIWSGTYLYRFDISWRKIWISCSWHQYHGMIQLHNDYSHSTGSMYMSWVSASSCHHFKGEISRDKSNYLTVFLFLEKYRKTIQMIWMCHNPCEKYRKTSHMIWTCPIHYKISKYESDDLNVS